jgi:HD-like signal output (HDOD) protein/CheY-like chemotaxis protein
MEAEYPVMKRILFVDDETNILDSLRTLLRKQRKEWAMTFVTSGQEALAEMLAAPFDVIVSDMRMPKMDGAALLRQVQQDYPHVIRIVLSGQTEQDVARRMVHVAHQFLSKPCEGRELQQTIERACSLQALLEQPALRQLVGRMGQLPVKPTVYTRLLEVLQSPGSSMSDAAAVIERDMSTSAKLLQVVNSAFFGLANRVGDVRTAVSYLGLEMVKMLALSVEMRESQGQLRSFPGFSLDAIQEHGLVAARIARRLLPDKIRAQDAFSAAMLEDVGILVLMSRMPDAFAQAVAEARESRRPLHDVETERLGVGHAEIGAYLLGIWGLPYPIVEAVAHHHHPGRSGATTFDVMAAVHVAGALAEEAHPPDPGKHLGSGTRLDEGFLQQMGVHDRLPEWRALAREEAAAARS